MTYYPARFWFVAPNGERYGYDPRAVQCIPPEHLRVPLHCVLRFEVSA